MRRTFFLIVSYFLITFCAAGQSFTEWHDPVVNSINRASMHASYFAYENDDKVGENVKGNSEIFISLNG